MLSMAEAGNLRIQGQPGLRREFQDSQSYIERTSFKKKKKKTERRRRHRQTKARGGDTYNFNIREIETGRSEALLL